MVSCIIVCRKPQAAAIDATDHCSVFLGSEFSGSDITSTCSYVQSYHEVMDRQRTAATSSTMSQAAS